MRRQPLPFPPGGRARPQHLERSGAGRAFQQQRDAGHRRQRVLPNPRAALLLLVCHAATFRAEHPERRCAARSRAARGAHDRRLGVGAGRRGEGAARERARPLHTAAALVRRQGTPHQERDDLGRGQRPWRGGQLIPGLGRDRVRGRRSRHLHAPDGLRQRRGGAAHPRTLAVLRDRLDQEQGRRGSRPPL